MVIHRDKYKCMKINKYTNRPECISESASAKFDMRLTPFKKDFLRRLSNAKKKSMSKVALEIIDYYIINAVTSDFWVTHNKVSEKIKRISQHEAQKF